MGNEMNEAEFEYILQNGESYLVEFKEDVNSSLSREVTAFANASGGKIYIGITDSGEVKGIKVTNKLKSQIQDIANNCQPAVKIELVQYENILIVIVPEGTEKPYQCSEGFFVRMGTNAQKMKRDQIIDFLYNEGRIRFEEQIHKKFDFKKDYSPAKLAGYLKMAGITQNLDDETVLINLGVAEKVNNELKMKNAGVLFFSDSIQLLCEQATITCGVFDGTERFTVLNRKDYTQDIITNIDNALHFVRQELRVKYEMTGTARRKEIYELPLDALREAVINAVVHRDYFLTGSHTVIEIFDDRIEISNPGGLPRGLTEKEFGKKAVRRNQLIASLLHRIDFVENMGTGITKIRTLLEESGSAQPQFEFGDFYSIKFTRERIEPLNDPLIEPLIEPLRNLLNELRHNPKATKVELSHKMSISRATITRQLKKLKELSLIKRIGSDKSGHWEVIDGSNSKKV
ncbi:MAG: putative DNA binding domain-containing protein [Candidatus Delongbacteria bacterium]|nr:putative DNA binding domain-containing protein [Candidatus Delongbacteria bacterium]